MSPDTPPPPFSRSERWMFAAFVVLFAGGILWFFIELSNP